MNEIDSVGKFLESRGKLGDIIELAARLAQRLASAIGRAQTLATKNRSRDPLLVATYEH